MQIAPRHNHHYAAIDLVEDDTWDMRGAERLKEKIEAYWRERGHDVIVTTRTALFNSSLRAARYDIRSDMVNGLPRGAQKTHGDHH